MPSAPKSQARRKSNFGLFGGSQAGKGRKPVASPVAAPIAEEPPQQDQGEQAQPRELGQPPSSHATPMMQQPLGTPVPAQPGWEATAPPWTAPFALFDRLGEKGSLIEERSERSSLKERPPTQRSSRTQIVGNELGLTVDAAPAYLAIQVCIGRGCGERRMGGRGRGGLGRLGQVRQVGQEGA